MSLLQDDERQKLIEMILRLPNIRETGVRRSLIAGLPEMLRNSVGSSELPNTEVMNIVEVADGEVWGQLPDGAWSIIRVVENSVVQVRGSKLGADLEALLNTLKKRAVELATPKAPVSTGKDQLTGLQLKKLHAAFLSAFDENALELMLMFRLNQRLDFIVKKDNLNAMVFDLLTWAQDNGKLMELIYGALAENPGNEALRSFAEEMGFVATSPVTPPLLPPTGEAPAVAVAGGSSGPVFMDPGSFLARMSEAEPAVCRVELSQKGTGTGFLVGPSVVMTSYHVVNRAIENPGEPQEITLRFGYKMSPDGTTLYQGQVYRLASDWLIDSDEKLEFALLRVAASPGDEPVGNQPGGPPRRWLNPKAEHTFQHGDPLYMIQHPLAGPLKIAYASDSVVSINAEQTQLTYRMSTAPGSAGAPCFTDKWELVAMHHSANKEAGIALGTPMSAIVSRPKVKAALGT